MIEQRTKEWHKQREGRFTGSQIHRLMANGKGELLGKGAITYVIEKLAEVITDGESREAHKVDTYATRWGNEWEPKAFKIYSEFSMNTVDECDFYEFGEHFGASPDGIINENGSIGVLEIKCPYTTEKHIAYLMCKDASELFAIAPEYYYQMQAEMICTGLKWADFVSYDPRCDERTCLKVIRVSKDETICADILKRVDAAGKMLTELLTNLYK